MNKFLTKNGGMPIWLEDLDFMQDSCREALSQIVSGLTGIENPTCIVYGCDESDSGVSDGIVCLNGEIMPLEESSIDVRRQYARVVRRTILSGDRVTKNGSKVQCHEYSYAMLVEAEDGDDNLWNTLPRISCPILVRQQWTDKDHEEVVWKQGNNFVVKAEVKTNYLYTAPDGGPTDNFTWGFSHPLLEGITRPKIWIQAAMVYPEKGVYEMILCKAYIDQGRLLVIANKRYDYGEGGTIFLQFMI